MESRPSVKFNQEQVTTLVPLLGTLGPKHPVLAAVFGLIVSCGAIYGLGSIARGLGKRLEARLVLQWGGMPTTLILRHRDSFLDSVSKARYHKHIEEKLNMNLPSAAEELADPAAADDAYIGATRLLREVTRGKNHTLLLKENIAYGFHRNMRAVRPIGILSCLGGICYSLLLSRVIQTKPYILDWSNIVEPGVAGGITLAVSLTLLAAWMYFTESAVKQMGYVYAERLFESLTSLPSKRRISQRAQSLKEES